MSTTRYDELESWRGLAALAVVVFHLHQNIEVRLGDMGHWLVFDALRYGVSVFFVLSGFVIFLPFVRAAIDGTHAQAARGFLIRRAARLLPLYWVAILTVWAISYAGPESFVDLFEHLTFTQVFDSERIFHTIGPAWSLAIEVMFYAFAYGLGRMLIWLCRGVNRRSARTALCLTLIVCLGLLSLGFKAWAQFVAEFPLDAYAIWFSFPAQFDQFALGMALAVLVAARSGKPLVSATGGLALALAGITAASVVVRFQYSEPGEHFTGICVASAFLLVMGSTVLAPRGSLTERALKRRSLTFLGLVSYSVYMWHEPVMRHTSLWPWVTDHPQAWWPLGGLAVLALVVAVATVSHFAIERPGMEIAQAFTRDGRLRDYYRAERFTE